MHERVKRLAEQAGFNVEVAQTQHNGQILSNSIDRLVNSVVRECADIADHCAREYIDRPGDRIKEDFGLNDEN